MVAAAISVVYNEEEVLPGDIADALRLVAVSDPSDIEVVEDVIKNIGLARASKEVKEIEALILEAETVIKKLEEKTAGDSETATLREHGQMLLGKLRAAFQRSLYEPQITRYMWKIKELINRLSKHFHSAVEK